MTEIDSKLKELALKDWDGFLKIVGEDSVTIAKARLLRKDGKSYRQISIKIGITPSQVRHACNNNNNNNKADKK